MYNIKGPTCCAPGIFRCETSFPWHVYLSQLWCVVAQTGILKPASRIPHRASRLQALAYKQPPLHLHESSNGQRVGLSLSSFLVLVYLAFSFVSTWRDESLSQLHTSASHLSIVETPSHPTPVRGARARRWIALKFNPDPETHRLALRATPVLQAQPWELKVGGREASARNILAGPLSPRSGQWSKLKLQSSLPIFLSYSRHEQSINTGTARVSSRLTVTSRSVSPPVALGIPAELQLQRQPVSCPRAGCAGRPPVFQRL